MALPVQIDAPERQALPTKTWHAAAPEQDLASYIGTGSATVPGEHTVTATSGPQADTGELPVQGATIICRCKYSALQTC